MKRTRNTSTRMDSTSLKRKEEVEEEGDTLFLFIKNQVIKNMRLRFGKKIKTS